jgi:hypothetical protein
LKFDSENPKFSYMNIVQKLDGEEYNPASVKYNDALERSMVEGNHPVPFGYTDGTYKAEGSLELFMEDFNALQDKYGEEFYKKSFDVVVQYAIDGGSTITDTLVGCKFKKRERDHSRGSEALKVTLELDVLYIKWNGKNPFKKMPGQR